MPSEHDQREQRRRAEADPARTAATAARARIRTSNGDGADALLVAEWEAAALARKAGGAS